MRRGQNALAALAALLTVGTMFVQGSSAAGAAGTKAVRPSAIAGSGPTSKYDCKLTTAVAADAFTGADGTASAIGWEGNQQGVVTCLGGIFLIQAGIYKDFGFGIYNGSPTTWTNAEGYLPAQITSFDYSGAKVTITEFADRLMFGSDAYVAVYSRVAVSNPTGHVIVADPHASTGLVPLARAPNAVAPHTTVAHDYVAASDRFGGTYAWPSAQMLAAAGSFDRHFSHMRTYWNDQLAAITQITIPDRALEDAYRSGFIYTQIARSGNALHTGVNGYEAEFSHDVIGILSNLFNQGYFTDATALLLEARNVMGAQGQYDDGVWTYSVPWAIYLEKTGDLALVKQNFNSEGPLGAAQPSIEDTAHTIAAHRTGPSGIMGATNDIDSQGFWTTDDYSALLGLAAYYYLALRVGDVGEATWALQQYGALLAATNQTLVATISRFRLHYLPCSILQPNTANRCQHPEDANWTSSLGSWAWEAPLFGASVNGPGLSMIDATYDYGFGRLKGKLPPNTFGGFPGDYYSATYNAGDGTAGLASKNHRDQGIKSYQFMIANSQSGPYSWWESSSAPSTHTSWIGRHPATGQGSSPHAWGIATANRVLLDSIVTQRTDGVLLVGRGIPPSWLGAGIPISVTNFPTTNDNRLSVKISSIGRSVSLKLGGAPPSGQVLFELPSFIGNIARTSSGSINQGAGTVTLSPRTRSVVVQLRVAPRP
jgi:hypothetical protein